MTRKWFGILSAAILVLSYSTTNLSAQEPREGIVVHGHWLLEVHNPDGTIAERREFENALTQGSEILAQVLAGRWSLGNWSIRLPGDVTTLNIANPGTKTPGQNVVVLTGLVGMDAAVTLQSVETLVMACDETLSPAACKLLPTTEPLSFSGKTLTPPLALLPNQYVFVTVTYTFGSPAGS